MRRNYYNIQIFSSLIVICALFYVVDLYGFPPNNIINICSQTISLDSCSQKSFDLYPVKIINQRLKGEYRQAFYENFAVGKDEQIIFIDKFINIVRKNGLQQIGIHADYRNPSFFSYNRDKSTLLIRGKGGIADYNLNGTLSSTYDIDGSQPVRYKDKIVTFDTDNGFINVLIQDIHTRKVRRYDLHQQVSSDSFSQPNVFLDNDTIYIIQNNTLFTMPLDNPDNLRKVCFSSKKSKDSFYSVIGKINSTLIIVCRTENKFSDSKICLLDIANRRKTDIFIHNIRKNLTRSVDTDDGGSDEIEYSLWIDKVVYYYDNSTHNLYFLINTDNGIEVYKSLLRLF